MREFLYAIPPIASGKRLLPPMFRILLSEETGTFYIEGKRAGIWAKIASTRVYQEAIQILHQNHMQALQPSKPQRGVPVNARFG
jgi:hypothetical protein